MNSRAQIEDELAVLSTNSVRDRTPTVGIGAATKVDAPYVALGYDTSGKLSRVSGNLEGGSLRPAQASEISTRFANGGEGAVLVDPASKGTVIAVLTVSSPRELRLSSPKAPIENAGYRIERGVLDGRIDQALGYFTGEHYTHAVPLLQSVIETLPDRELRADLAKAKQLSGTPEDKSERSMTTEPSSQGISRQSLLLLVLAGLGALALAVAVVLVVRRRRGRMSGSTSGDGETGQQRIGAEAEFPPDREEATVGEPQAEPSTAVTAVRAATPPSPKQPGAGSSSRGTTVIETGGVNQDLDDHYCSACGVSLVAGDRFCYHCGTPVR